MDVEGWKRAYEAVLSRTRFREEDCDEAVPARHIPFLERLDAVEGSSIALFDLRTRSYRFLTASFRFLGGYPVMEARAEGPDFFFRVMHGPDLPFVLETTVRTFKFLDSVPTAERKDWKLSFDFRIRHAAGRLVRLLQQVLVLELDARGNPWLVLIANDLAPMGPGDEAPSRRLENLKTGEHRLFGRAEEEGKGLSQRELEILGLVAEGLPSREIAERLYISVATVNNHRRRILEKLDTRSSAEAVRWAAARGLV